jgi:hypothetical protein
MDLTGEEVKPYIGPIDAQHQYTLAADQSTPEHSPGLESPSNGVSVWQGLQTSRLEPFLTVIPPPPASNATSFPHSIEPPSSLYSPDRHENNSFTGVSDDSGLSTRTPGIPTQFALPISGISSVGTVSSDSPSPTRTESAPATTLSPRTKSHGMAARFTAQPTQSPFGTVNLPRMRREGRETDMGPLAAPDDHQRNDDILPPDYQQATEPLPGQRLHGSGTL